jgi:hypothetical protein
MSTKEAVRLAGRVLAIFCLLNLRFDVTYLPASLHDYVHHVLVRSDFSVRDYWVDHYLLGLLSLCVRMVINFFAAIFFWRCGPWAARMLTPRAEE